MTHTFFQSRRPNVYARHGMVAASQPLAAQVGLDVLKQGGTAADAAVAAAAMLNVVEPMMTGVGGDCFALYWDAKAKTVTALNGSGRAAAAARPRLALGVPAAPPPQPRYRGQASGLHKPRSADNPAPRRR